MQNHNDEEYNDNIQEHFLAGLGIKLHNNDIKRDIVYWRKDRNTEEYTQDKEENYTKHDTASENHNLTKYESFENQKEREIEQTNTFHTGDKPYLCFQCNKVFTAKSSLLRHMKMHTSDNHNFTRHDATTANQIERKIKQKNTFHTGAKSYQCNQCDKDFTVNSSLIRHMRIHTAEKPLEEKTLREKPHQCTQCDKAFSLNHKLTRHMRVHSGEKPHQCSQCDKAFSQSSHLKNHQSVHTGEKPYQCPQCDKAFANKYGLIEHKRIHTGERPFQCSHCDKAFTANSNLITHMKIHSGARPYQCSQCNKTFSKYSDLLPHMMFHTGVNRIKQ